MGPYPGDLSESAFRVLVAAGSHQVFVGRDGNTVRRIRCLGLRELVVSPLGSVADREERSEPADVLCLAARRGELCKAPRKDVHEGSVAPLAPAALPRGFRPWGHSAPSMASLGTERAFHNVALSRPPWRRSGQRENPQRMVANEARKGATCQPLATAVDCRRKQALDELAGA